MKITGIESEREIIKELGRRIKQYRISLNLTQDILSEQSGVSLSTIARIESGNDASMANYIKILSSLRLSQNIDILVPEIQTDLKDILMAKKPRERARQKSNKQSDSWIWEEDK